MMRMPKGAGTAGLLVLKAGVTKERTQVAA
jgi:hypothetical protein